MASFTFGSFNSETDFGLRVNKIDYGVLPEIVDRDMRVPGRRGRYDFGTDLGARIITFTLSMFGASYQDIFDKTEELASWLNPEDGIQELSYSGRPGRTWLAKVTGDTRIDHLLKYGRFSITFKVPDGVAYGEDQEWNTGDSYPGYVEGSVKPPCQITATIQGSCDDLVLVLDQTGETITVDGPFVLNDVIVITEEHYVTKNGSSAMASVDIGSDFFLLPKGTFSITPTPANTVLKVEWTERWL